MDYNGLIAGAGGSHAELRLQTNTDHKVVLLNGELVGNTFSRRGGVCSRVCKNGSWGFASGPETDDDSVREVVREAASGASFLDSRVRGKGFASSAAPGVCPESVFTDVPQKDYIEAAKEIDANVSENCPRLASRTVVCVSDCMDKTIFTASGVNARTIDPRVYIYVFMTAETDDGGTVDMFTVAGGRGYLGPDMPDRNECRRKVDELYENLMKKREGVFPEAGVADVILDAALAGMLAHEAVGHTCEADLVTGGSVAGKCLGKPVASELVTLTDYAHTAFGSTVPLPLYTDDEGTLCEDAVLIKDGILTGYMHNIESAARYGMKPCGNARAHFFTDEPLIRMRNTAISPGTSKLEDMIASIDNGYYLLDTGNGQADITGEFMFGINFGYEIKNGKLGRPLRDTTISGVAFEMLKSVTMLSDTVKWSSSGYCGKKQLMPVSLGGPDVKCRVSIGGR